MSHRSSPLTPTEAAAFDKLKQTSVPVSVASTAASTTMNRFAPDVLVYAEKNNVEPYLQPLLDATHRIFPRAEQIKVYHKKDPEAADDAAIIYDVRVGGLQYPESWAARKAWIA